MSHHQAAMKKARLLCISVPFGVAALTMSCGSPKPKEPDLARLPDRWVRSVALDTNTKAEYIGKTKDYGLTTVTSGKELKGLRAVNIGDVVSGVRIGAIKCSFFWRDASYGGRQYMWRGRWGCMAGRSKLELENAVGSNGEKRFDYIYLSPVQLSAD